MKKSGIFVKVFLYTIIFSALLVGTTAALFSGQLISYFSRLRIEEIRRSYQRFASRLAQQTQGEYDITELGSQFYGRDPSFQFYLSDKDGRIVYKTPDADLSGITKSLPPPVGDASTVIVFLDNEYDLLALRKDVFAIDYDKWIARALVLLAAMLAACIAGALAFAGRITKPIQCLVDSTKKMADLQEVPPLPERRDELGILARDVHSMYIKLKETISKLEEEILREREAEEAQRYFFSAASHELKTPIAATSVLLEGMLENVGDYKDHPKYLRECVKLMDAQGEAISEILEIVNLSNGKIVPVCEKLDIGGTVAGMLPDFRIMAEAKAQRIVAELPREQICLADPDMLQKALSNVLLNAVQNTPEGGEIRIWTEPGAEGFRLRVLNTGARIEASALAKLFDPFYREDQARSRKSGGRGLGLTIVRKALDAMNISFALENTPEGVLFWMELPKG